MATENAAPTFNSAAAGSLAQLQALKNEKSGEYSSTLNAFVQDREQEIAHLKVVRDKKYKLIEEVAEKGSEDALGIEECRKLEKAMSDDYKEEKSKAIQKLSDNKAENDVKAAKAWKDALDNPQKKYEVERLRLPKNYYADQARKNFWIGVYSEAGQDLHRKYNTIEHHYHQEIKNAKPPCMMDEHLQVRSNEKALPGRTNDR